MNWNKEWWQEYLDGVYNASTEKTNKQLARLYRRTALRLKRDIENLYNKFDKRPEDIIINDLYKNNQYYKLLSNINKELSALGEEEIKIMDKNLLEVYEKTSNAVSNQIGFQRVFDLPAQRVVHSIWCQDGKDWSDRVWSNKAILQERLEERLVDCVARGLSKDKAVNELCGLAIDGNRSSAERIVRTELTRIQNQAAKDTYKEAGLEYYEYLCIDDDRTSEDCLDLNGKIFRLDEAVVGENFPPIHPNCRCSIIPVVGQK